MEKIGRFELVKKIAAGGMAEIFLARRVGPEGFEKYVVIKRILPHLAENREFVDMFLQEARLAVRLNHPNIAQVFDLGESLGSYFIAMEYVHGEDLRRIWRHSEEVGSPIPVPLACRIIIEAAAGLDYAHKKAGTNLEPLHIVHRDVSPQNILVSFDGAVKVVDFGIAKATDQATNTHPGVLKGKYSYMSPEQASGHEVDWKTDQFALGIIFYELLTLTRLFKRRTDIQTLAAVGECKVSPPSLVNSRVPAELDAIVLRALAKRPADRYRDMLEFRTKIEDWLLAHRNVSSSTHLARYLGSIYSERLEREKTEGWAVSIPEVHQEKFWSSRISRLEKDNAACESSSPRQEASLGSKKASISSCSISRFLKKRFRQKAAVGLALTSTLLAAVFLYQSQAGPGVCVACQKVSSGEAFLDLFLSRFGTPGDRVAAVLPISAESKQPGWIPQGLVRRRIKKDSRELNQKEVLSGFGVLVINSDPQAYLWQGPNRLGKTPLRIRLPAGRQQLALVNQQQRLEQNIEIVVPSDQTVEKTYQFGRGEVCIVVKPINTNAEIYLRGQQLGANPLPQFSLLEGQYQFTVVNEDLRKAKKVAVQVKPNQVARVVVDFDS